MLIWDSSEGKVNYKFTVAQSGVYCAKMSYFPLETTATTIELSMLIDGESPYDTASRITLNKRWVNERIFMWTAGATRCVPLRSRAVPGCPPTYRMWMVCSMIR